MSNDNSNNNDDPNDVATKPPKHFEKVSVRLVDSVSRYQMPVADEMDLSNNTEKPFTSVTERTKAMSDPRYKTDPAYRNWVNRKLAAEG